MHSKQKIDNNRNIINRVQLLIHLELKVYLFKETYLHQLYCTQLSKT